MTAVSLNCRWRLVCRLWTVLTRVVGPAKRRWRHLDFHWTPLVIFIISRILFSKILFQRFYLQRFIFKDLFSKIYFQRFFLKDFIFKDFISKDFERWLWSLLQMWDSTFCERWLWSLLQLWDSTFCQMWDSTFCHLIRVPSYQRFYNQEIYPFSYGHRPKQIRKLKFIIIIQFNFYPRETRYFLWAIKNIKYKIHMGFRHLGSDTLPVELNIFII